MSVSLSQVGKRIDDFICTRAIELVSGGAKAYERLASRYESLGWYKEAAEAYKKAVQRHPPHAPFQYKLARIFYRLDHLEDA